MAAKPSSFILQLRVKLGSTIAFGPGKAELLEHIGATGSISAAARRMRMSYKRAWQLVDDMNQSFRSPLVSSSAGGAQGGGARLTANGAQVLKTYRELQRRALTAARTQLRKLARLAGTSPAAG